MTGLAHVMHPVIYSPHPPTSLAQALGEEIACHANCYIHRHQGPGEMGKGSMSDHLPGFCTSTLPPASTGGTAPPPPPPLQPRYHQSLHQSPLGLGQCWTGDGGSYGAGWQDRDMAKAVEIGGKATRFSSLLPLPQASPLHHHLTSSPILCSLTQHAQPPAISPDSPTP